MKVSLTTKWETNMQDKLTNYYHYYHSKQNVSFFSLAKSPPRDPQLTAYK